VRCWRETYAGIIPQDHIERRTVGSRAALWNEVLRTGDQIVFVACDRDGKVVGFASGTASSEPVEGFDAELGSLYILPEAQREKSFRSVWVRVLTDNPAVEFYKRAGAEFICKFYGWRDVATM